MSKNMSKKNFTLPVFLALSSLLNCSYAGEKGKTSSNSCNVLSHVAAFGIGGLAGSLGSKYFLSDPVIKEKNKTIVEKDNAVNDWEKKYKKLEEENDKLKNENDYLKKENSKLEKNAEPNEYFNELVEYSGVKWWLKNYANKDPNKISFQSRQMLRWMLKGRCFDECFKDDDYNKLKNSIGNWLGVDCLDYFKITGVDTKYRDYFCKIFGAENPLINFNNLSPKYKNVFIEMAVKHMVATALCKGVEDSGVGSWRDLEAQKFYKKYHEIIAKQWQEIKD